jgi:hypothetical protein
MWHSRPLGFVAPGLRSHGEAGLAKEARLCRQPCRVLRHSEAKPRRKPGTVTYFTRLWGYASAFCPRRCEASSAEEVSPLDVRPYRLTFHGASETARLLGSVI